MEVKNPQVAVLSNYEVFELIKKTQENTKVLGGMSHSTILYEVHKYMENKACAFQSVDKIRAYLMKLKNMPMNLTKKEKLLLINDPPDSVLQLSLGIKDFYDRLSENETEMLLNATRQFSGQVKTDGVIPEITNGDEKEEDTD